MLQEGSKPELQGRVFGLYGTMYSAFMPVGMAIFGPLSDVYSLRAIMIITGILLILLTVFSIVRLKK